MAVRQRSGREASFPHRFAEGRMQALAREDAERMRSSADVRRQARVEHARRRAAEILPGHVDIAAMALMLLEEVRGPGNVSRSMLIERCRQSYPDAFEPEAAA